VRLNSKLLGAILWPAFLGAAVGAALLFTLVDPAQVAWLDDRLNVSPLAAYTVGFFGLWLLIAASASLSLWLYIASRQSMPASGRDDPRRPHRGHSLIGNNPDRVDAANNESRKHGHATGPDARSVSPAQPHMQPTHGHIGDRL